MTDEEVKKGLECCAVEVKCNACPYVTDRNCREQMNTDALALINRLEQENAELRDLCRKKSNGMRLNDWLRMTHEANYEIKLVSSKEIEDQIRKETAKVLIEELEYYSGYEDADLKGGISCLKQYAHEKFGVEVE